VLDPTHRQQVISCGVAVEFAAVALRAAGLEVEVEVVPGCEHPDHLATVRVTGERAASAEDRALAAAIGARHTQRAAFEDRAVPSGLVDQLQAEAGAYGVWLEAVSRSDAELAVVALLNRAEEVEQGEPAYRGRAREVAAHRARCAGRHSGGGGAGRGPGHPPVQLAHPRCPRRPAGAGSPPVPNDDASG
jgi:hypothetical protein